MKEPKFLTLPTSLGAVTVELQWEAERQGFAKGEDGHLWHRFDEAELAELAQRAKLSLPDLQGRLEKELDLDGRLG